MGALPAWYLEDLAAGWGVVEELIDGDGFCSPSTQIDMLPGGNVRVLATHDQIVGGPNGQVLGCRFPASPGYAAELARHGAAVGVELSRRGAAGNGLSIDFAATRDTAGVWRLHALEINLRKGGTTHPYAVFRNLVPGRYDPNAGRWVADQDGSARAYRATDNVVDPAWIGRPPSSVIDALRSAGLQFDPDRGTGVALPMLACLAVDGRFGATAIGSTLGTSRRAVRGHAHRHQHLTDRGAPRSPAIDIPWTRVSNRNVELQAHHVRWSTYLGLWTLLWSRTPPLSWVTPWSRAPRWRSRPASSAWHQCWPFRSRRRRRVTSAARRALSNSARSNPSCPPHAPPAAGVKIRVSRVMPVPSGRTVNSPSSPTMSQAAVR